jgi:hypothetical protein
VRLVAISDLHCGHRAGLTPPGAGYKREAFDETERHFAALQSATWDWYAETLADLQPIDTLVVNGDAIDGKGERSGGTEQFQADRHKQVELAARCIQEAKARKIYVIRGTPYHTGREEDFEDVLAQEVDAAHIGTHDWIDCEGVIFDFKHKVSTSSIPHGRHTGPARAALWNALWAERGLQPRAQVIIRSHAHYFDYSGDARQLVMVTPALQGFGSKYGAAECEGTVDVGLIHFDCEGGMYSWQPHLMDLAAEAARPLLA